MRRRDDFSASRPNPYPPEMSIYATLWILRFPSEGDHYPGCIWVEVLAQGVPAHIGATGSDEPDRYGAFLPPPVPAGENAGTDLRAIVFVTRDTRKGSARSGQEYVNPLLVLAGKEYAAISADDLIGQLSDALRGSRPRLVAERQVEGTITLVYEDGSTRDLPQ